MGLPRAGLVVQAGFGEETQPSLLGHLRASVSLLLITLWAAVLEHPWHGQRFTGIPGRCCGTGGLRVGADPRCCPGGEAAF